MVPVPQGELAADEEPAQLPGMYDPGRSFDNKNVPVVIPPAFGLRQVRNELYTDDDTISYWNQYVAVTQMHGQAGDLRCRRRGARRGRVQRGRALRELPLPGARVQRHQLGPLASGGGDWNGSRVRAAQRHQALSHHSAARALESAAAGWHYDGERNLGLTAAQKADLVEYLKTL